MQTDERDALDFQRCAEALKQADALLITAGAGMGVDSGLPDFRGTAGFWQAYPALAQAGLQFSEVACPDTFHHDPALAWGFYGHRLKLYRTTQPHAGFAILREFARNMAFGAFVYTSNVDGQFQQAGFSSDQIIECHGSIHYLQCLQGCRGDIWSASGFEPQVDEANCRLINSPPRCPHCGGIARPNIFMFGDGYWLDERFRQQEARYDEWRADRKNLVVIELGAGTAIPSVRYFSEYQDGFIIRINPREPNLPARCRGVSLAMPALAALLKMQLAGIT
jgi:NAD-dependent SIR2 family protein deacetylase